MSSSQLRSHAQTCHNYVQKRFIDLSGKYIGRRYALLFMGAPGVGKGTYAKLAANHFQSQICCSGDLVRAEARRCKGTSRGDYLNECIATGNLVSDDIVIPMVFQYLRTIQESFLLDGFPRTLTQAQRLQKEYFIDLALLFELPDNILIAKALGRRMCANCGSNFNITDICEGDIVMPSMAPRIPNICDNCQSMLHTRVDDNESVIVGRLRIYHSMFDPIIDFYRQSGTLLTHQIKKGVNDMPHIINEMKAFLADNGGAKQNQLPSWGGLQNISTLNAKSYDHDNLFG